MAQSSEDTVVWKTAQWEANKLLQLNEPEYVGSGATKALWSSMGPCEKTDDRVVRMYMALTWVQLWLLPCHFHYEPGGIFDSMCVSLAWTVLEPREFANQRITAHKLLYVGKVWHWGGGDWDNSDREIMKNIRVVMIQNRERRWNQVKKKEN